MDKKWPGVRRRSLGNLFSFGIPRRSARIVSLGLELIKARPLHASVYPRMVDPEYTIRQA